MTTGAVRLPNRGDENPGPSRTTREAEIATAPSPPKSRTAAFGMPEDSPSLTQGFESAGAVTLRPRRGACRASWGCPCPVSYTHLRAHETRHDLVCRLLLE